MSLTYQSIEVAVVIARLKGEKLSLGVEMARRFFCGTCGAPPGFACWVTDQAGNRIADPDGSRQHGLRPFTGGEIRLLQTARMHGRSAPGGFRDEIYTGFHAMGYT